MNKKIEDLAKESCLYGYMVHLYTVYAPDGYRVPLENRMISVEKFAELIIKETLEVVRDEVQYALDDYLADTIDPRVKHHFGIE